MDWFLYDNGLRHESINQQLDLLTLTNNISSPSPILTKITAAFSFWLLLIEIYILGLLYIFWEYK